MIIAIANRSDDGGRSLLADHLALLRAASGRKVLLMDTDPGQPSVSWSAARSAAGPGPA
ncbi:MAG: Chromosome partitioning protein [Massilia sp.]|nr:Chromosome partitioning protein [Massilia sp.]